MAYSYKCYSETKDVMKKYVNATEGAIIYSISKTRIMVLAKEAGAVYKVGNSALINTELFAVYISIPVVAPIALGGFYSYQGMSFYEVMKRRFYFMFHNKPLTYVSTESVDEIDKWNTEQKLKEKNKRKRGKRV